LIPRRSNEFTIWRDGDWKVIDHYLPNVKTMEWSECARQLNHIWKKI